MKRKASQPEADESPTKLSKESSDATPSETPKKEAAENANQSAGDSGRRQRKAPAWLASYVTDNNSLKEASKAAAAASKVSGNASPNKKKSNKSISQNDKDTKANLPEEGESPPSMRKISTLKIENSSVPTPKATSSQKSSGQSISVVKKDTQILSSSTIHSGAKVLETKPNIKATNKKLTVQKVPNKAKLSVSSSSSSSNTSSPKQALPKQPSKKIPSKRNITSKSSINVVGDEISNASVMEVCDTKGVSATEVNKKLDAVSTGTATTGLSGDERQKPNMLEIVICISTSGAMREYLSVLQDETRDLVWRLQGLIPKMRIGVFAHTQGGIHDDKPGAGSSAIDHNYIRTGGHSGTKWLDLGASFSQICAFVDSLVPEATVYPDYVQDNLEMALWKLQRCMSWSSCSYRTVIMMGRGRPNRTSFYLQREHWRGWIRSALEIGSKAEIPIIDWELEAKLLAQMGIHVFTVQAVSPKTALEEEEDEGSIFFRRVAEITNGQHIKLTEPYMLVDIMVGICCACHGPDLLQEHRDMLRDQNDGVVPQQLKDIFIALQLHSKRRSLATIPSLVGDLSALQQQLAKAEANGNISGSEEDTSGDEEEKSEVKTEDKGKKSGAAASKASGKTTSAAVKGKSTGTQVKSEKPVKKSIENRVKAGGVVKNKKVAAAESKKVVKKAVKAITSVKDKKKATVASEAASKVQAKIPTPSQRQKRKEIDTEAKPDNNMAVVKGGRVTKQAARGVVGKSANVKAAVKLIAKKNTRIRGQDAKKETSGDKRNEKTAKADDKKDNIADIKAENHAASTPRTNSTTDKTEPQSVKTPGRRGRPALNKSAVNSNKTPATDKSAGGKTDTPTSRGSRGVNTRNVGNTVKAARQINNRKVNNQLLTKSARGNAKAKPANPTSLKGNSAVTRKALRAKK